MAPVVAQQRARNNQPKDCTAYPSLWHNRNVQHSDEELKLRHQELGELLELEVHGHRDVGHHAEEHEEDDASSSSSSRNQRKACNQSVFISLHECAQLDRHLRTTHRSASQPPPPPPCLPPPLSPTPPPPPPLGVVSLGGAPLASPSFATPAFKEWSAASHSPNW